MELCSIDARWAAPGYRTDGELLREAKQIAEMLASPEVFLNETQRGQLEQRLAALKAEQDSRRRARGGDPVSKPPKGSKHTEDDGCQPYPGTEDRDPAEDAPDERDSK